MDEKEYIIFCDESDISGKYYSNFYGGVLVGASQIQRITNRLNDLKRELNFFGEVKWGKVGQNYLSKYQSLIDVFFDEINDGNLKIRIMFRQNAKKPMQLNQDQLDNAYFLLYYQFIKHAFGLRFIHPNKTGTYLRLYFDKFPDTKEKAEKFRKYLMNLVNLEEFRRANIKLSQDNIAEVNSHDHVLLQCLDIVLGSMSFRLNDKQKILVSKHKRGKRTIAKEILYKSILNRICEIIPNFNIGVNTNCHGDLSNRWNYPYMHWCFVPKEFYYDPQLTKRKKQ